MQFCESAGCRLATKTSHYLIFPLLKLARFVFANCIMLILRKAREWDCQYYSIQEEVGF